MPGLLALSLFNHHDDISRRHLLTDMTIHLLHYPGHRCENFVLHFHGLKYRQPLVFFHCLIHLN